MLDAGTIRGSLELRPGGDPAAAEALLDHFLSPRELRRMEAALALVPPASSPASVLLDIGASVFWVPAYAELGYRDVQVIQRHGGFFEVWRVVGDGDELTLRVHEADAELEPYPMADASVEVAVCFELLEHLAGDPMHCVAEANRLLVGDGTLCLTTPNVAFIGNLLNLWLGRHPFSWSVFTDSYADRHNREYTPNEIRELLAAAGFSVESLMTPSPYRDLDPRQRALARALAAPAAALGRLPLALRGEQIAVRARKAGPVRDRYPAFLYDLFGRERVELKLPGAPRR